MFTGIVEELGTVRARNGGRFELNANTVTEGVALGDSIACNGVCLTVVDYGDDWFAVDAVGETLARSTFDSLRVNDSVNLERPVRVSDRLGGHIVQGHVDGVGTLRGAAPDLSISCEPKLLRYMVEKGSITIDGISLTIVSIDDAGFTVAVIPHTMDVTTLGTRQPGDRVNLEVDVIAKYVERLLDGHN
ncbi:MAG TPA: riboflavin synthase [Acidimicrobiales bacterium]|nr:riboflavin synthase [Acidimicrobiales bacterium]